MNEMAIREKERKELFAIFKKEKQRLNQ